MVMISSSPQMVRETAPTYGSRIRETAPIRGPKSLDSDELFMLGERIASLSATINAAEFEMLTLIAEFDQRQGWEPEGFGSCAEWLAWRTGIQPGSARERVRAALALRNLPETSASMERGELSFTKVRALTRVATRDSESALLCLAHAGSAANLERTLRSWQHLTERGELGLEEYRHRNRRFSMYVDDDGMYVIKGRLEPEVGALLMRAVDAASDALYRAESAESEPGAELGAELSAGLGAESKVGPSAESPTESTLPTGSRSPGTPHSQQAQRRADAIRLVAERALAHGFRPGKDGGSDRISGSRAERYQVVLHVGESTLDGTAGKANTSGIHNTPPLHESRVDTVRVSAETSRRLCCDSSIVVMTHGSDGSILDLGRKTRSISPALRRALEVRDRGCRFPGCGCRFTDGHHLVHWTQGGPTSLENLLLLCDRHHRAVHEGGVTVVRGKRGKIAFFAPNGRVMFDAPPVESRREAQRADRVEAGLASGLGAGLADQSADRIEDRGESRREASMKPAWRTGACRYKRDKDVPWRIEARARDALE